MTKPRPDTLEPTEARRASSTDLENMSLHPPSPISPINIKREDLSPSTSPALGDSRTGSPSLYGSEASDTDQSAPGSSSPESGGSVSSRAARRGFSGAQLAHITSVFEKSPYPSREKYHQLANTLNADIKSVKLWFQNKRCKARKQGALQGDEQEVSSRSSSSDDEDRTSVGIETQYDDVTDAKRVKLDDDHVPSGPAEFQAMTVQALPPDHPFCQLGLLLPSKPTGRRQRRAPKVLKMRATGIVDSPVSRPAPVRSRSHPLKKIVQEVAPLPVTTPPSIPAIVRKPEVPLWRPMDDIKQGSKSVESAPMIERQPNASAPLDLSVSLKRKRDSTGSAPLTSTAASVSGPYGSALPAGYPMMYPGAYPFYHPHPAATGAGGFLPVMPQMTFPVPHMPMGMYGQTMGMWPGGMPVMAQPQKPVR